MRNYGEYEERDKMEKKDKKDKTHGSNRETPWHTCLAGRQAPRSHPIFAVSVIVTVKDDPEGEKKLMEALAGQTVGPDEVVVARADKGVYRSLKEFKGNVRVVSVGADCSRGRGRNIGVRAARNEVIAVTDAGCRPHKDWLNKLYKCYKGYKKNNDNSFKDSPSHSRRRILPIAIAGWYRAEAKTELQGVMAHFLAPVDYFKDSPWHTSGRILSMRQGRTLGTGEGRAFLPASRSIMFTKKAWELAGGYPEEAVSGAEDLEFARRLAAHPEVKMIYCPQALVDWDGPATLREFFRDIVKHTRGNVEVGYWPHLIKNFTVVLRWMVFLAFPWMIPIYLALIIPLRIHLGIRQGESFSFLFIPIVQLAADGGVIVGLVLGVWGKLGKLGKIANVDLPDGI